MKKYSLLPTKWWIKGTTDEGWKVRHFKIHCNIYLLHWHPAFLLSQNVANWIEGTHPGEIYFPSAKLLCHDLYYAITISLHLLCGVQTSSRLRSYDATLSEQQKQILQQNCFSIHAVGAVGLLLLLAADSSSSSLSSSLPPSITLSLQRQGSERFMSLIKTRLS